MPVTFILGRAGSGKTRYCLDALLSELDHPNDTRRLILLVPEQASFQMERALATRAARGGYSRAAVLSFSRLARRALAESGISAAPLSPQARAMALRCLPQRMGRALHFHRAAARTNGFYAQLDRLIEELLLEQVSWQELVAAARKLDDPSAKRKLAEIARLYREYLDWLGRERIDPALRLAALRERLEQLPWLPDASIWVDGFAGYTGQELATLVALARVARELTLTLLLDPAAPDVRRPNPTPDPLHLFQRTEQTYQRLTQMFQAAGVTCRPPIVLTPAPPPRFTVAPTLARLEAGLATPLGVPPEGAGVPADVPADEVALLECTTHRDELRQAARFMRQKVVDSGGRLRFRDFAVIARDLEPFAQTIAEVFAEYDLPYFLDRRRPMRAHPVCLFSTALFEALTNDFSVAAATRLLRTGLLPLTRSEAEELENIVVAHAVKGIATWRQSTWDFARECFPGAAGGRSGSNRERQTRPNPALDAARRGFMSAVDPLVQLTAAREPPSGATWARTFYEALEALGVRRRIETWISESRAEQAWERAETHRLAWEALCGVLGDLYDVLGTTPLRADELAAVVGSALREQTLGLAPPTLDQVLVSAIERSRHPDIKYAWVFAFNEGVFPARPPDEKLLTTAERDLLAAAGLSALAGRRDEAFAERLLAYIAFTRPSCGLTISYATVGDDGAPQLPSPLLDEVKRALPALVARRPEAHSPPACASELAREYLHVRTRAAALPRAWQRYERLGARVRQTDGGRLDWLLRGTAYRNAAETVKDIRPSGESGVLWSGSLSEVETFLDCPFKHFATYGLQLDPARGPRPTSWDLGEAAHALLADVTRRAMTEDAGVRGLSDARWQALLQAAIEEFKQSLPADLGQRRPELAFLAERLYAFLNELVAVHAERWRRGGFEPLVCEQAFGRVQDEKTWPALELTTPAGQRVHLRGQIDRVDGCRAGGQTWLLVYDYKPRCESLSGRFLTGARLQLFSYLCAAQQALAAERGVRVAGVFLAPLYPDWKALGTGYVRAAPEREQRMYLYRPRGFFVTDVARHLDPQLGQNDSPVAAMKLKKDGDFDRTRSRDVVAPEDVEQRLDLAQRTVLQAAQAIAAGEVVASPLVEDRTLACRRCDFRSVCRFDRALNRPRAAETALPTLSRAADPVEETP